MNEELPVIAKAFDLARELTRRSRKLPRDLRFVLGDRMLTTSYDVLDLLIEAQSTLRKRLFPNSVPSVVRYPKGRGRWRQPGSAGRVVEQRQYRQLPVREPQQQQAGQPQRQQRFSLFQHSPAEGSAYYGRRSARERESRPYPGCATRAQPNIKEGPGGW